MIKNCNLISYSPRHFLSKDFVVLSRVVQEKEEACTEKLVRIVFVSPHCIIQNEEIILRMYSSRWTLDS